MMRVMVVEDDAVARNRLCSMLDWEAHGCELIAEAADGAEALDLAISLSPDLVLADVSMPVMDGMQLSRALAAFERAPQLVMISSYSHYEYIRETFRNGARDYRLKEELTPDGLASVLAEARTEWMARRTREAARSDEDNAGRASAQTIDCDAGSRSGRDGARPAGRDAAHPAVGYSADSTRIAHTRLPDLLLGLAEDDSVTGRGGRVPGFPDGTSRFAALLCRIGYYAHVTRQMDGVALHGHARSVLGFIDDLFAATPHLLHWTGTGEFLALLPAPGGSEAAVHRDMAETEARIQRCLSKYLDLSARTAWVALDRADLRGVHGRLADRLRFGADDGRCLSMPWLSRLMDALQNQDEEACAALLDGLFESLAQEGMDAWTVQPVAVSVLNLLERQIGWLRLEPDRLGYSPESIYHCVTLAEARDRLKDCCARIVRGSRQMLGKRRSPHVDAAVKFLHARFRERVSLGDVADAVGVAPNYLSGQFSSEMGRTLIEYLNGLRIEAADRMLERGDVSVKEVYHRVGFQSYSHFFRIYKAMRGTSPLQRTRGELDGAAPQSENPSYLP